MDSQISSKEVLEFSNDFFPSALLSLIILYFWKVRDEGLCNSMYSSFFFALMVVHLLFALRGLLRLILQYYNYSNSSVSKISLNISDGLLYIFYYVFIFSGYFIYRTTTKECFMTDLESVSLVFFLLFIGIVCFIRQALNILLIILGFPVIVSMFYNNPTEFYSRIGVDPEIINNLPTFHAEKQHIGTTCIICTDTVNENDELLQLRCQGRHYFHALCIKDWLKRKVCCPLCRNTNIL